MRIYRMEIKTTKEIINNELGVILNSVDYDVNNTLFEVNKYKKWIAVKDIEELNKHANLRWCAEVLEKEIEKHNSPATNIRSIASHLRYQLGILQDAITSDSRSSIDKNDISSN